MINLNINQLLNSNFCINGIVEPFLPILLSKILKENKKIFLILNDDKQLNYVEKNISLSNPNCKIITVPAWDTIPYDISSPNTQLLGTRIKSITNLINIDYGNDELLILSTFNASFIKNAPINFYQNYFFKISISENININLIKKKLVNLGYTKVNTVRENCEFSIRGDIIDLFINGYDKPVRIYLNDEHIERINYFNPLTQRNVNKNNISEDFTVYAGSEIILNDNVLKTFKKLYSNYFKIDLKSDFFYTSIISGQKISRLEYYLKLFFKENLSNIYEIMSTNKSLENTIFLLFDKNFNDFTNNYNNINNYYERRKDNGLNILPPNNIYLSDKEIISYTKKMKFLMLNNLYGKKYYDFSSKKIFIPNYGDKDHSKITKLLDFITEKINLSKSVIFCTSNKEKLLNYQKYFENILNKKNIFGVYKNYYDLLESKFSGKLIYCDIEISYSFDYQEYVFISENDLIKKVSKKNINKASKADEFLKDLNTLKINDYVAHVDHGVGIYKKLEIISISGHDHDCLKIEYFGGDKLFVPVENINLLSKIGESRETRVLDKLGSSQWLLKKNKIKNKIDDLAQKLINTAAYREVQNQKIISEPKNYSEFIENFPFDLTEDQDNAVNDVLNDLYSSKFMDRLICGDVGFGKTEVALRASFVVASSAKQVVLIAPTTILVEQHYKTFYERFKPFNINVKKLSRMTKNKDKLDIKGSLSNGKISIIIGTHSLLSRDISFSNLGLIIIDEEQHFGVVQKERLKEFQFNIHILTLSATPIPRTLQLSLTGLKDLSLITTPPVNRLAVRTFINEWDKITLSDAIKREINRDGQIFVVCPRVKDIPTVELLLKKMSNNLKICVANGQMSPKDLENNIISFYKKKCNILISTNIIESGIDIPNANTLIVFNADMFGLSQLYQLRGRVGRSDRRAYAYFTTKKGKFLNDNATQRLKTLKTLDNLGAGFSLANYDLDFRGAGNLLGDEQSGQIRDIGYELYQKMLLETIEHLKKNKNSDYANWSPSINISKPVLIPEEYVEDLSVRMSLYRKIGDLRNNDQIKNFMNELIERFGPLPLEVTNLIYTISLKIICIKMNINFIDIGPKAIVIGFRKNEKSDLSKLIDWVNLNQENVKFRKDEKLIISFKGKNINRFQLLKAYLKKIDNFIKS